MEEETMVWCNDCKHYDPFYTIYDRGKLIKVCYCRKKRKILSPGTKEWNYRDASKECPYFEKF